MLGDAPRDPSNQPSKRALRYYRAGNAVEFGLLWLIVAAIAFAIAFASDAMANDLWMLGGALLGLLMLTLGWFCGLFPPLAIRYRRYEIGDDAVFIQRGFFGRRRAIVPFARVQFVRTKRGPVERWFSLGTVELQTAAGSESIAMLDDEVADALQERISLLTRRSLDDI